jgi:hypothetical protein
MRGLNEVMKGLQMRRRRRKMRGGSERESYSNKKTEIQSE